MEQFIQIAILGFALSFACVFAIGLLMIWLGFLPGVKLPWGKDQSED